MSAPLVFFIFAGRRANMEVQWPWLERLLDKYPESELHLWDLTRTREDAEYLSTLETARVKVFRFLHPGHPIRCRYPDGKRKPRGYPPCECLLHKPPYEKPYQWYAYYGSDTRYVKMDDDVLFLETERVDDLLGPLVEHPNRVISANVVNNAVCAKYEPDLVAMHGGLYDPREPKFDRFWWAAHTSAEFARHSHYWFLSNYPNLPIDTQYARTRPLTAPQYVRTRPGEAISINCIAFTQITMNRLARSFTSNPRLGDEGVVDSYLPWIALSCRAAHLSFGPQDKDMTPAELDNYRRRYGDVVADYLHGEVSRGH